MSLSGCNNESNLAVLIYSTGYNVLQVVNMRCVGRRIFYFYSELIICDIGAVQLEFGCAISYKLRFANTVVIVIKNSVIEGKG